MTSDKMTRFWSIATLILITMIITSSLIIWIRHDKGQPLEISTPSTSQLQGTVIIEGAVNNPGQYPLQEIDSIENLIEASGGLKETANISQIRLYIPSIEEEVTPQKIDINRADTWLLQSLPGIGEVRAQAIVDYRQQFGLYHNVEELINVPGISVSTYEKIKDLITIAD